MSEYIYRTQGEPLANERGEIHLACAGEIVRCRDCKHYHPELYNNISCEWFMFKVEPDGFCKWAVRRKES